MEKEQIKKIREELKIPIPWPTKFYLTDEGKRILQALNDDKNFSRKDIAAILDKSVIAMCNIYIRAGISRSRQYKKIFIWTEELDRIMLAGFKESGKYPNGYERNKFQSELLEKINATRGPDHDKEITWKAVGQRMSQMPFDKKLQWGGKISKEDQVAELKKELIKEERSWNEPEILEVKEDDWKRPGVRRGYLSRIDYKDRGYRSGTIQLAFQKFCEEGTHLNALVAGLISKPFAKKELKRRLKGVKPYLRESIIEHFVNEAAKELAAVIPKIKTPASTWTNPEKPEFVRLYIITSPVYDGPYADFYEKSYGKEIVDRVQQLRPEDIVCDEGGRRLHLKILKEVDWAISPVKQRLPSKYYSTAAEREIEDKIGQSDQSMPDLWIIGGYASALHKTKGEKGQPYITLPACCRLEATTVAENQEGIVIVESVNGERLVRFWNFKDLIHNEKKFITGIKEGANDIHKKIVNVIKNYGSVPGGTIADELNVDKQVIDKEIEFLLEPKMSSRKTWPGLRYDSRSRCYDFHLDWLQERLRYSLPKEYYDERFLLFGCLHAGYTTTDYQHFVQKYSEIILNHNIKYLCGLGDFTAGLKHDLMHRGEIVGAMNNTDQEKFAAELVATIIFKVFKKWLENGLASFGGRKPEPAELKVIAENSLPTFLYITGNHDEWQLRSGTTPLEVFRDKLVNILDREIGNLVSASDTAINVHKLIEERMLLLPDFRPIYVLPSGLIFGARHPGMARASTTSLRAQHAIDALGAQVAGIANFHVATIAHKWQVDLGQCVAPQAATQVIYTPFEGSKLKKLDFGPIYLRVLSHAKRIYMSESGYFNEPILKEPISKWSDVDRLKDSLKILRV